MRAPGDGKGLSGGDGAEVAGQKFRWHGLSSVDLKGRLSVPAAYRQTIEARGGGRDILMSKHPGAPCIVCYDRGFEEELDRDLKEQRRIELERGDNISFIRRHRGIYSTSAPVSWDSSGRVILPDYLKDRAHIGAAALFVAFGDGFEIWDPQTALEQAEDEDLRELAAFHLREKGAAS
ncbi:MAG: transcriptional regulator MraZ [Sphingomonadales bacterium]|jgi:MraZ protein|nr:transcriptional regulator MraZ [Sphingomonadales bacterium]MEA3045551.1 transcriptional regulator MraZ [Sphingomonadales bacterium]